MIVHEIPVFEAANDDRGDFADSDGEDDIEEGAENIDRYFEGLYYPICIGEILSGRYRIIHKLGHGGFSTVWMAYDTSLHKDVALKIMIPGNSGEQEYHMHKEIAQSVSDTSSLLLYEETFILHAPSNIQHRVLVLPLLGPNIRDSRFSKTPVKIRMSAAVQLLWTLKSLHDGGIVHCDLNDANVLYRLSSLNSRLSTTDKYKLLGRPQKLPLQPKQWRPGELLLPMKPQKHLIDSKIMLGDFGLAIEATTMRGTRFQSPAISCAPERFHQQDPTFASDI